VYICSDTALMSKWTPEFQVPFLHTSAILT
jgi:hypothetical protein